MAAEATYRTPPVLDASTGSVELADALVRAGVPFRTAHRRVGVWLSERERTTDRAAPIRSVEMRAAFPELPKAFRFPGAEEEPERRTSQGGSSWRSTAALLAEVEQRRRRSESASGREIVRLKRLRRSAGIPERLFA
jgi:argininosuccinate lyase